mmetsp:Transcript_121453/g.339009  ORF Transcript_121453/g.339009 Transcript_121453/m.339009 type:complete len:285 (+) Transcript_121453:654-1508(+)
MNVTPLVKGHVEEAIVVGAITGEELHEVFAGAAPGDVAHHNSGPRVLTAPDLLRHNVKLCEVLGVHLLPRWRARWRAPTTGTATSCLAAPACRAVACGVGGAAGAAGGATGDGTRGCRGSGERLARLGRRLRCWRGLRLFTAGHGLDEAQGLRRCHRRRLVRPAAGYCEGHALGGAHVVKLYDHVLARDGHARNVPKGIKPSEGVRQLGEQRGRNAHSPEVMRLLGKTLRESLESGQSELGTTHIEEGHQHDALGSREAHVNARKFTKGCEDSSRALEGARALL